MSKLDHAASLTSTANNQPKVHKYRLRCFIFATESS